MRRSPQLIGDSFEQEIVKRFQGEQVPGSGSGKFYKLDVRGGKTIIISCKATDNATITLKKTWFQEVKRVAKSVMAGGGSVDPALALDIDGESGIWFPLDVAQELMTTNNMEYIEPDKAQLRRAKASKSLLS